MLPLTQYTDTDAVRAVVGITDNEVSDTMLTQQALDVDLTVDLGEWLPTHATIFAEGQSGTATAAQILKMQYLQMYARFFCALHLLQYMELAIPQMIGDGKAEMRRFADTDFDALRNRYAAALGKAKAALKASVGQSSTATPPSFASAGVPTYDPVEGP